SRDPPDHALARLCFPHHRAPADAEVEHAAQLLLVDVAGEPAEDERALPRIPVDLGAAPLGQDAFEVAQDAAAGYVRERERTAPQPPRPLQIEPRRRQQVRAVVVLLLEDTPYERETVCVDAG